MTIETEIKQHLVKNFLFTDSFDYPDDASFLEQGIVDSLGLMSLVGFVEEKFGVYVEDEDIIPENLDSVKGMADYVRSKRG
jgi:acyl carrier protein